MANKRCRHWPGDCVALNRIAPQFFKKTQFTGRFNAILGDKEKVREHIEFAIATKPLDAVTDGDLRWRYARSYALAGMTAESVEQMDHVLSNPSRFSRFHFELDPAFDAISAAP